MSPEEDFKPHNLRSFPRVSGDEPNSDLSFMGTSEFSPRERG